MVFEEPVIDDRVRAYAVEHDIDMFALDWHLEAQHGWERHDAGYEEAIPFAANCIHTNLCDGRPVDIHKEKD
jgi:hypothetical protein